MTGGLLQIVTSGKQDIYLTINPQITFFKKVYRRHTNFSLELKEINPEQTPEYNNISTFIINVGDAIHRCYFEIELPNLSFSDKYINDTNYKSSKTSKKTNYQTQMTILNDYYNNLKGYSDIEIQLYVLLYNLLQSDNITINIIKDETKKFNYKYKSIKDQYYNKIDKKVFDLINITGYINDITKLITNDSTADATKFIQRTEIINQITTYYNNMIDYLKFYNTEKNEYYNKIIELEKTNQINFSWAEYLGHNFFTNVSLEIGGREFVSYDNDILHINQMHYVKPDYMNNYLDMIGHTADIYDFNNNSKGGRKILVPLINWFNKDSGSSLPLVAMQYSPVVINAKINDIKKIIAFENYEKMFNDLTLLTVDNNYGFILNDKLIYSNYDLNYENQSITYHCNYINDELLKIQFPDLQTTDITHILQNYGTNYVINKMQWVGFMMDIKKNSIDIQSIIGSYYPFINFNLYYSLIPSPKIKLICETVFLDDVERAKFANSKLEYVVEKFNIDIFDINNKNSFDCELSFNNTCKELLWYVQPQIYLDGLSEYSTNINLIYDTYKYINSDPINKQNLTFNQLDVLFSNVDNNYWTNLLSYKFLNNILPDGIYYNSFCLYPEETQPSGTVNLKRIKGKQYQVQFNTDFINEYNTLLNILYKNNTNLIENKKKIQLKFIAKCYDLFVVHKGQSALTFDS